MMSYPVIHVFLIGFLAKHIALEFKGSPQGVPLEVIVNDGGVVIESSPEAGRLGVERGMPLWRARKLAPGAVVAELADLRLSYHLERFFHMCYEEFPFVEPDESLSPYPAVYLKGGPAGKSGGLKGFASHLAEYANLISVGIGSNRLTARAASLFAEMATGNLAKVFHCVSPQKGSSKVTLVRLLDEKGFLARLPLEALSTFVKPAPLARLRQAGLGTIGEIQTLPVTALTKLLGLEASVVLKIANGEAGSSVHPLFPLKDIRAVRSCSPGADLKGLAGLLATEISAKLRAMGETCTRLLVDVSTTDKEVLRRERLLLRPTSTPSFLKTNLIALLQELPLKGFRGVTEIAVTCGGLAKASCVQPSLWNADPGYNSHKNRRQDQLEQVISQIKKSLGKRL